MRARYLFALVLLGGCSDEPVARKYGALWTHREEVAEALTFRKGELADTMRKPIRQCRAYWSSGDPADAGWPPAATCDALATQFAELLSSHLGIAATAADVRDPELLIFIAERAGI